MVKIISSHYELGQKKESLKDLCEINKDWDYDRLLLKTGIKNVVIGDGTSIESNVTILGPVIIGENCKIITHSNDQSKIIIGPNDSIGNNSIISVSSVKNSIIMQYCIINSSTNIKDSIIASNSEIKDNSVNEDKTFLLGEGSNISL